MHRMKGSLAIGLVCAAISSSAAAQSAEHWFDKPWKTLRLALPRDKDNPDARPELRCTYYPHFMVKEIDLGEVGDFQLSILPAKGRTRACRRENAADEKIVSPDSWTGSFKGAVDDYILFDADDGWNGGLGFAVFTPDAKKLFDDVAKSWISIGLVAPPGPPGMSLDHALALHYVRVYGAKCSLANGTAKVCWQRIKRETGLEGRAPDCMALYAPAPNGQSARRDLNSPTVIDYDAVTTIAFNGIQQTAATHIPLGCRPAG